MKPLRWLTSRDRTDNLRAPAASGDVPVHNHDGLYSALGHGHDYAATSHTHDYAATGHDHDGDYAALVHSHPDVWTYVVLGSDFTTSTTANSSVTGLSFTPSADTSYEFEGRYLLQTATTTTGARPGIAWPTGYVDGAAWTTAPNSVTAFASRLHAPATGTSNAASTGLPVVNRSHLGTMRGMLLMGGSPSGNFHVTLGSETNAVTVTMKTGSFIRYRVIP